ncbi:MAG: magnesium chelatase [Bacteroidota bacterium]|nr:magnesium chelatase [Candidatus Kapabacteria bacterium]MCS7302089.1 magnesium chelatase [Candidatus Kapabacteria bacterium]MCX7936519.1 magnesium chelatase [Chlorobiota bacterium]MDW8074680.1 magnesium chelatase [Bacteroidota bacterium]MDW8270844.1 magnesium chelatase [Bacteroidota bacterium]
MKPPIHTLGQLKASGYRPRSVKDEIRANLIEKLRRRERLFPGIIGFDDTVIPELVNALLARHDILLLGLRGQAKTRLARSLVELLDEYTPIVAGSEINDDPLRPISRYARDRIAEEGDDTPIEWIHRTQRYGEKLATPDVTVADLIGDIDPIKAAVRRLAYSDEGAMHFGIIPRTNRGIFVINELPDLQPRIQVALFNILQERDVQIRGFPVRLPLDLLMVFTANPEDYTSRGRIITPLKDRIESQILTHYPRTLDDAIAITRENAWIERNERIILPRFIQELVEMVGFAARQSEYVDQSSGVSARMTIALMELIVSNAERRAILNGEKVVSVRVLDFQRALAAITGKIELVFEGEQEGAVKVAKALIGKAVRELFVRYAPDPLAKPKSGERDPYAAIVAYFEQDNTVELDDELPTADYYARLAAVPDLERIATTYIVPDTDDPAVRAVAMELVLEALHNCSKLAKEERTHGVTYSGMLGTLLRGRLREDDLEE